jgi:hypothetical protein
MDEHDDAGTAEGGAGPEAAGGKQPSKRKAVAQASGSGNKHARKT